MDNIIELIVFLFVIYSILSTAFGKKKTQKKRESLPAQKPGGVQQRTPPVKSQKEESLEVLEDLFGFKIPKPYGETPANYRQKYEEGKSLETTTWNPEAEFEARVKARESVKPVPDIDYDKLASLEKKIKKPLPKPHQKEVSKDTDANKRAGEIRKKLKNAETVKELFIISEILNRPKAARRRMR